MPLQIALHLLKSHTVAVRHVLQIITYSLVDKEMEYNGEQRQALVEPGCKDWSCCGWQKGRYDVSGQSDVEIKPVTIAIIKLRLSEGISKLVSKSVKCTHLLSMFTKLHHPLMLHVWSPT